MPAEARAVEPGVNWWLVRWAMMLSRANELLPSTYAASLGFQTNTGNFFNVPTSKMVYILPV